MKILERLVQQVNEGQWEALEVLDQKYNKIESELGFPPKRRYRVIAAGLDVNTIVIEREWESMAAMEATIEKAFGDERLQALNEEGSGIIASNKWELYSVME